MCSMVVCEYVNVWLLVCTLRLEQLPSCSLTRLFCHGFESKKPGEDWKRGYLSPDFCAANTA